MKANSVKLDGSQRVGLRGLGLALVLSGAAWAWVHRLDEGGEAAAWSCASAGIWACRIRKRPATWRKLSDASRDDVP